MNLLHVVPHWLSLDICIRLNDDGRHVSQKKYSIEEVEDLDPLQRRALSITDVFDVDLET